MRPSTLVVFDGQSLNNLPDGVGCYPARTMADLGSPWTVAAISGLSWTRLATTAASRLWPLARQCERSILVLNGGCDDIVGEANSGAQAYLDMVAYSDAARAAGFDAVIGTTIGDTVVYTADQQARRRDCNARILASSAFDRVVDTGGMAVLCPTVEPSSFAADGVHYSEAGAAVAAAAVRPAVLDLLGSA